MAPARAARRAASPAKASPTKPAVKELSAKKAAKASQTKTTSVHWLPKLQDQVNRALEGCPPGPRCIPHKWHVNAHKGGTLFFVLALCRAFDNWEPAALAYAAAHGSYGLVWLMKHCIAPDASWEKKATVLGTLLSQVLVLLPYWFAPYLLVSRAVPAPSPMRCCLATCTYVVGVALMVVADTWKHVTLRHKPGLITDGPFRYIRHPNYLGEMLVYGGFAAFVPHWAPWAVLAWVWLQLFLPNMLIIEARISRHAGWDAYKQQTSMLVPWLL